MGSGRRKMKIITIQIEAETAEALEKIANSYEFREYPLVQVYRIIIERFVLNVQNSSRYFPICCCCIPEHQHPPAWCRWVRK
jgi:hypothetical protein